MGILDAVIGGVLNQATGGGAPAQGQAQGQDPLASILGSVLGGGGGGGAGAQGASPLVAIALALFQQKGGLTGILDMFRQKGMGQQVDSWVGTGENMPLTGQQVQHALGDDTVGGVASQLGVSPGEASTGLAQLIPSLVNGMTPQGNVPSNHGDLLSQALGMLTR